MIKAAVYGSFFYRRAKGNLGPNPDPRYAYRRPIAAPAYPKTKALVQAYAYCRRPAVYVILNLIYYG